MGEWLWNSRAYKEIIWMVLAVVEYFVKEIKISWRNLSGLFHKLLWVTIRNWFRASINAKTKYKVALVWRRLDFLFTSASNFPDRRYNYSVTCKSRTTASKELMNWLAFGIDNAPQFIVGDCQLLLPMIFGFKNTAGTFQARNSI